MDDDNPYEPSRLPADRPQRTSAADVHLGDTNPPSDRYRLQTRQRVFMWGVLLASIPASVVAFFCTCTGVFVLGGGRTELPIGSAFELYHLGLLVSIFAVVAVQVVSCWLLASKRSLPRNWQTALILSGLVLATIVASIAWTRPPMWLY